MAVRLFNDRDDAQNNNHKPLIGRTPPTAVSHRKTRAKSLYTHHSPRGSVNCQHGNYYAENVKPTEVIMLSLSGS